MKYVGLIINPYAGIGGKVGLKGSDGINILHQALERGAALESGEKAKVALEELVPLKDSLHFYTPPKAMGEDLLKELGFSYTIVEKKEEESNLEVGKNTKEILTTSEDTIEAVKEMKGKVELLLFAGGDGTARNIYEGMESEDKIPCIGIPAGVKIHSGVYGNTPKSSGIAAHKFLESKEKVPVKEAEVMDIDEEKFRGNQVFAKLYGYLYVPQFDQYIQNPKTGQVKNQEDISGIADEVWDCMDEMDKDTCFVFGTGSTTYRIMEYMELEGTLLGVDVVRDGEILLKDADEQELKEFLKDKKAILIVTAIGGQGHIFGRGNQQLSPEVLRMIGTENIWIVATIDKIRGLDHETLRVDTSDAALDQELSGYKKVIIGYQERFVCKVVSE